MFYEKRISEKGKVSYIEHRPEPLAMAEIDNKQVISLVSALVISMLLSIEEQFEPHAALGRRIKGVEEAIVSLAQLNGEPLDPQLIETGVNAWRSAVNSIIKDLETT